MKQILLIKIDATGMDGPTAIKHSKEVLKHLKECFTKDELRQLILLSMPTFEGDKSDIQVITTMHDV